MSIIGTPTTGTMTTEQQKAAFQMAAGLFGMSLGTSFLTEVANFTTSSTAADPIQALYDTVINSSVANQFGYFSFQTSSQFTDVLVAKLLPSGTAAATVTAAKAAVADLFAAGKTKGQVAKIAVDYLATLSTSDATYGSAAAQLANRVTVSEYYTLTKNGGSTDLTVLSNQLSTVTATASTVTAAQTAIDTGGGASTGTGTTYTLTTSADNFTGTNNNDAFNAYVDAAGATDTFNASDSLDGGAGTDTINITTDGAAAGALPAATVTNVEVWKIREVGGTAGVYDLGTVAGETSVVNNKSTDDVTLSNLAAATTLTIAGDGSTTNGATTFTMASATDAVSLTFDGGTTAGNVTRNATGAATVTINSTGAANKAGIIDLDTATAVKGLTVNATTNLTAALAADYAASSTLTITGAATTVDLRSTAGTTAISANFTKVDASGLTAGGAKVMVDQTDATVDTQFVGGVGADALYVGKVVYSSSTLTADAGSGTDTLGMTDAAALTSTTAKYLLNFEALELSDDDDGAMDTFDASLISGLASLKLNADSAADGYTVTNMSAAMAAAVTIAGTQTVAPVLTVKDATQVGNLDTLKIDVNDGSTTVNTLTLANITAAGVETVQLTATDNLTLTSATGLSALTSMTLLGAGTTSITTGALALNVNTKIDASGSTATTTFNAAAATTNALGYTGNSKVDTVTYGVIGGNVISTGAGADVVKATDSTGGTTANVITLGAGADTFNFDTAEGQATQDSVTFKFVAGDSVSTGTDVTAVTSADTISAVAFDDGGTAANGQLFTIDTEQTAVAVTVSTTAATFGTTAVTNAYDFYVKYTAGSTDIYVYQDTDGDKKITSGDFMVKLVADANIVATNFANDFAISSSGGNLVITTNDAA